MIVIRSHTSRHMALLLRTGLFCTILLLLAACGTSGPAAETTLPTEVPTATTAPTVAAPTATAEPAEEDPTATPEPEEEAAADSDPDPVDSALAAEPVEITPAEPQGPSGSVVAEAGVNVRTGPGTDYPILGVAPQGATGEIVGVSEDGQWWVAHVPTAPNEQGWVATAYIEATNAEDVPIIPAPPLTKTAAPVADTGPAATPVPVPEALDPGSLILFSASRVLREGNRAYDLEDIYAVAPQPGSTAQLIIENGMEPALLRGGEILAFRSTQPNGLGLSAYDFGVGERVRYSSHLEDSTPRWSPTGDRLLFSSNRTGDRLWRLYIVEPLPSNDATGFPEAIDLGFGKDADWRPTAELIVFKGCDDYGDNCGLWTINPDGSERAPLTDGFNDSLPRWSPDGASVLFMSDSRDGNWEIYVLTVTDGAVTRLTDNPANDGLPVWSPDGSRVAFMSDREGAWGIWVMTASGGDAQLITQLEEQMPDWLLQGLDWPR
ncbi:MAG: PD40 domain-containing protein [Caldilineaceae bacterium]|nr:PD40 domain-containing protein [Caldilineaceae bacterium]